MIRLGIVGTGGMAEYQAKKFGALADCALTACVDHQETHAKEFALRFGIGAAYPSLEEFLTSGAFDAVSCVVLDIRHRSVCEDALRRGYPVFCEKPLGRSVADCVSLAALAAETGLPALVNFSKRNAPALWALKDVWENGSLGVLREVRAEYRQGWVATKAWGDWLTVPRWKWRLMPEVSTAGLLGDLGTHLVDALLLLFGSIEAEDGGTVLRLREAMEEGLVEREELDRDLYGSSGETVPVAFEAWGRVPASGSAQAAPDTAATVPVRISSSWIDRSATDDFSIELRGSEGSARLDLGRSRDSVELLRRDGTQTSVPGPRISSTYERFAAAVGAYRASLDIGATGLTIEGASPVPQRSGVSEPSFAHALEVHRTLDALLPGVLPS